eukprot:10141316-Karenia_brevis.AAC.1
MRQSVSLSTRQPVNPSIRQPVNLSIRQSVNPSSLQSVNPSTQDFHRIAQIGKIVTLTSFACFWMKILRKSRHSQDLRMELAQIL